MKCKTNNLTLIQTLTDPVTPYFIRPLLNKLAEGKERSWVRGLGAA